MPTDTVRIRSDERGITVKSTKANFERVMAISDEQKRLAKLKSFELENTGSNYWYKRAQDEVQKIEGTYKEKIFWLHGNPPVVG